MMSKKLLSLITYYSSLIAFLLLAQLPEVTKAVDAGRVAVAPAKVERIAAYYLYVADSELVRDGFRPEHSFARPFVDAPCAWAGAAQRRRLIATDAAIAPGNSHLRIPVLHNLARLYGRPASFHHLIHKEQSAVQRELTPVRAPGKFSSIFAHGLFNSRACNAPVRDVPDRLPVAQDYRLRRLVADAC